MNAAEKQTWVDMSEDVKRKLKDYGAQLAAYGLQSDIGKTGDKRKSRKKVSLPKGPRYLHT